MAANTRVTELDFDQIKANLKEFLKDQTAFTDYDFDGSNISVLLDLLAYNTHYNAVLGNMMSNEMFLDTALKRSSVASLAKHLRYTPRSIRSATARVNVSLANVPNGPAFVELQPYTLFTTSIAGEALTFYNRDSYMVQPNGDGTYTFTDVVIYEGRKLDYFYTIASGATPKTKYVIPNANVDTSTLKVKVTAPSGAVSTYNLVNDITTINSTSLVYYLEENTDGLYQIHFGDNVLGAAPVAGSTVSLEYLISNGTAGNVSDNIDLTWTTISIGGEENNDRSITTVSKPSGGQDAETVEQIRFNSVNRYSTLGRAVTVTDYASLVAAELPGAQSVNVWGGEKNSPPQYGKIFISIKPRTGYVITDKEKVRIVDEILRPRSLVTASHEFVEPVYTYLSPSITLTYNPTLTNKTGTQLASQANTLLNNFIDTNLEKFNAAFYQSQLIESLVHMDDSVVSINIVLTLQKRLPVVIGTKFSTDFIWPAKLHPAEILSNHFVVTDANGSLVTVRIKDAPTETPANYEGTGILNLVDVASGNLVVPNIGTVNYGTGHFRISDLNITGFLGASSDIRIRAEIQEVSRDIIPGYNEILVLDDTTSDVISNQTNGVSIITQVVRR